MFIFWMQFTYAPTKRILGQLCKTKTQNYNIVKEGSKSWCLLRPQAHKSWDHLDGWKNLFQGKAIFPEWLLAGQWTPGNCQFFKEKVLDVAESCLCKTCCLVDQKDAVLKISLRLIWPQDDSNAKDGFQQVRH